MSEKLLFKYRIEDKEVEVYKTDEPLISCDDFYWGALAGIAEYTYYPFEVIASRINSLPLKFVCTKMVEEKYILTPTSEALCRFLETHTDEAENIIPPYTLSPNMTEEKLKQWINYIRDYDSADFKVKSAENEWLEFVYKGKLFYGRYLKRQSADYLLVSLPCISAEWNDISYLETLDCDILQLSPLGYSTPWGFDDKKRCNDGNWPALYDTLLKVDENSGYNEWFKQAYIAIAELKKGRKLLLIGTSQGGGAALVLSSLFNDCTLICAAEMPFFVGLSGDNYSRVSDYIASKTKKMIYAFSAKERMFVIDPMAHAKRINCRTLLVSGEYDDQCPKESICKLYDKLECDKKYIELKGAVHGYTEEFKQLAKTAISEITEGRI